jgi:multidrug efflux pump
MMISDVSVKRPVFATVVSMLLVAFGILSFLNLSVREYPNITPPQVSISTSYPGASARVVETQITQVIEDQVNGIEGVDNIRSSSADGRSRITVEFTLDRDLNEAANDVRDRVSRVVARLPDDADPPEISKSDSSARPSMRLNATSETMDLMSLTDYVERYVIDQLGTVPGVANVQTMGSGEYSMRVWLDRTAMAARNLTVIDIENALRRENLELPAGRVDSLHREFSVRVARNYQTADDFSSLVLRRGADGHLVRLGEVATVEVAPSNLRTSYRSNGKPRVGLGIVNQSTANSLEVLEAVKDRLVVINETLPEGTEIGVGSDESVFIRSAISSVYRTIAITTALVSLVILLFLGSFRAMIIPAVTIPVCLTSAFIGLAAFGFSINLITLLALVLAIGLVVDDSIVVLENIHRRIEAGEKPLLAAFNGARQVTFAVIATTVVLVAVFVPILFLEDNIGRIFAELAVGICAAVIFSSVLALSLTPMMCSKLLKQSGGENGFSIYMDALFERFSKGYEDALRGVIERPAIVVIGMLLVGICVYGLAERIPSEFAPQEDQGIFFARVSGPEGASFEFMQERMQELENVTRPLVDDGYAEMVLAIVPDFRTQTVNSGVLITRMKSWEERTMSTREAVGWAASRWSQVAGVRVFPFMRSGLSVRGSGPPVQFILQGSTYEELAEWRDLLLARAARNPGLQRVDADYKETKPELTVTVDKDRAADLGVSVQAIGRTLQTMMSERRLTTYIEGGEEYDVILQAKDEQRASPSDLDNIYVRSDRSGELIPLSNLTRVENRAVAASLNRHNRLRSITISANLAPGYSLGEALDFLEGIVRDELPVHAQVDYDGQSLEFKESSGGLYFVFGLAFMVVFLVLAAQFESFVHPFVIMLTVPLAVAGALLGLFLSNGTLNIYSQIGIIMLMGIAAKNGILIVEFANQLRDQGLAFDDALIKACHIRFRPVIMTTVSTLMGSIPLMLAAGAGSESRQVLGIVIFSGVSLATVMTLFVVPVFYRLLGRWTRSPGAIASELDTMRTEAVSDKKLG